MYVKSILVKNSFVLKKSAFWFLNLQKWGWSCSSFRENRNGLMFLKICFKKKPDRSWRYQRIQSFEYKQLLPVFKILQTKLKVTSSIENNIMRFVFSWSELLVVENETSLAYVGQFWFWRKFGPKTRKIFRAVLSKTGS